jgi:hypothetical protein
MEFTLGQGPLLLGCGGAGAELQLGAVDGVAAVIVLG